MFAADAKQLLTAFIPLRLCSHVNATLHSLHAADSGVVAYVQKRSNLTRRVEFVRLQFHSLFASTLLEASTAWIGEQFIDVLADLSEVNLGRRLCRGSGHRRQDI